MCAFQALRTAAKSAGLRTLMRRMKMVFSAVTSRSRRTTEGFSKPAACKLARVMWGGLERVTEVTRQITAS